MLTRRPRLLLALCLILAQGWAGLTAASRVSISPVSLQLQPNVRATALTLSNDDSQPVTFDLSLMAWTQVGGQEVLGDTQAVVVAPATVTLAPGASQTVRLARLGAPTLSELAYRLLITERPSAAAGVSTRLQFSVPLFDGPVADGTTMGSPSPAADSASASSAGLPFRASLTPDGQVLLSNPGGVHLRLTTLEAQIAGVWRPVPLLYLLAGQGRLLDLKGVQALRYGSGGVTRDVALR